MNTFCMVFHVRWTFLTTSLRNPHQRENPSRAETLQNVFSHILYAQVMLNILCKVEDHENHARWIHLATILNMGK